MIAVEESVVSHVDQSRGLGRGRLSRSFESCAKIQVHCLAEARFVRESPLRVQQTLVPFRHVPLETRLRVDQVAGLVACQQVILGLWGFPWKNHLVLHLGERSRYLSVDNLHRPRRRMAFGLGRAEICRVDIGRCRGTVRQT